jgi:DNA invertase Pin-like site-specific DNA recombinase
MSNMVNVKQIEHTPPPVAGPLRVAAYCRVSSDSEDQLHSYAAQIKQYTDLIGQNSHWVLADIYADSGLTGMKTIRRDDLNRMVADCQKRKIDRVLVKSVSRFARNTYDGLALARLLKSYGVSVYFEEQDIDTGTMSDEFIFTMQSMAAQGESIAISQNMRWHYKDLMERGDFVGTIPAYGYKLVNRTLEIHEPEAIIVRRIFEMYLSGVGKQTIANTLNSEDVPRTYGNNRWRKETISYILSNERYIGDALLQKTFATDTFPFCQVKNHGQRPQYYVENSHPAIISREDFEAVQAFHTEKGHAAHLQGNHIFSGKVVCPDCGHTFRRHTTNGIYYWQCCTHSSGATKCNGIRYPEESVKDAFILLANKLAANRGNILLPLIAQLEQMQNRTSLTTSKVYEIDKQVAQLNQHLHTLAQNRSKGWLDVTDYTAKSGAITMEVSALRAQRRKLLAEDENSEQIEELRVLDAILAGTGLQTHFDGELFHQIVTRITAVSPSKLRFKLLGELELEERVSRTQRRVHP